MTNYEQYKAERMKDPEFKREYDNLEPEFAIVKALIEARNKAGLTQKELAERTGISQSDISKFERGNGNPSIKTVQRLADGMGMMMKLEFVPVSHS